MSGLRWWWTHLVFPSNFSNGIGQLCSVTFANNLHFLYIGTKERVTKAFSAHCLLARVPPGAVSPVQQVFHWHDSTCRGSRTCSDRHISINILFIEVPIHIQDWCLFLKSAARMGAYFHGVVINACNLLVAYSCVETDYLWYILGLEVCCQPPPTNVKRLELTKFLLIPRYVLSRGMPKFWFVFHVDSSLTIGDRHWRKLAAMFEKAESANSHLGGNGCIFMWDTYSCMCACKHQLL